MKERATRAIAFALIGLVGVIVTFVLMLIVDVALTALGTPPIVEKVLTPAIVCSVLLFLWGYFGRDE